MSQLQSDTATVTSYGKSKQQISVALQRMSCSMNDFVAKKCPLTDDESLQRFLPTQKWYCNQSKKGQD